MRTIWQDLTYGWRKLRRGPRFTAIAAVTLALGIGVNTAVFSVVHAVLLKPLPYDDPGRLVLAWNRMDQGGASKVSVSAPDVADLQERTTLFEGFAATDNGNTAAITGGARPEVLRYTRVSANFFSVLGVEPAYGRGFTAADDASVFGLPPEEVPTGTVILSYGFWQRYFSGDPGAVGRVVRINGQAMEVVGVMPAGFRLWMPKEAGMPRDIDAWVPLRIDLASRPRGMQWLRVIARLKEGVTLGAARAEAEGVAAWQRETIPFNRNMGIHVDLYPMHEDVVGATRPALLALFGAAGLVLLIACANVANLLLARGASRRREMAVLSALGASPRRLAGRVFAEGVLLAACGGLAAILAAAAAIRVLAALRPFDLPRLEGMTLEPATFVFAAAAALLTTALTALFPALEAASTEPAPALRGRGEAVRRSRLRDGFVVVQVALSLVLLIGAGLLLRSLLALGRAEPGFDPRGTLTYRVSLPRQTYPEVRDRVEFLREMRERVASLPGVQSVGAGFPLPLSGRYWTGPYGLRGESRDDWSTHEANFRVVTPGYLETLGARIVRGRLFEAADLAEGRAVAVVDTLMAERLWGDGDSIGREIGLDAERGDVWLRVVGVIEHLRHASLREDGGATVFFPAHVNPYLPMGVAVRAAGDLQPLMDEIRSTVAEMDGELPLYDVLPLTGYVEAATADTRFLALLVAVFAGLALVLAAVGVYAVLAHNVSRRTHEMGVRLALGARRGDVVRLVVGDGLRLTALGLVLGVAASAVLSRTIAAWLYHVTPTDPATFVLLTFLVLGVATAACYFPARRAALADPTASFRAELEG